MAPDQNITAWFDDAARRHPDIRHTDKDPRFFEEEWNQLMAHGQNLAAKGYVLVLEDYEERFHDPIADYVTITPELAFMVGKHVPKGKPREAAMQPTYQEARRIAKSIVAKLYRDCMDACDADVPIGVKPPVMVDINSLRIVRVQLPMFDEAYGVRATILIRTGEETTFERNEANWLPLGTDQDTLGRWPMTPLQVDAVQHAYQQAFLTGSTSAGYRVLVEGFANQEPGTDLFNRNTGHVVTRVANDSGAEGSGWDVITRVPGSYVVLGPPDEPAFGAYQICLETGTTEYSDNGGTGKVAVDVFNLLGDYPNTEPMLPTGTAFDDITTDRLSRIDPYRRMVWQWSTDENTWTDLPMTPVTETEALEGIPFPTLPSEAAYVRSKWTRGNHVQGYSTPYTL